MVINKAQHTAGSYSTHHITGPEGTLRETFCEQCNSRGSKDHTRGAHKDVGHPETDQLRHTQIMKREKERKKERKRERERERD